MPDCCDPDYGSVFGDRFARRRSRRYRRRGLTPAASRLVEYAAEGVRDGGSVLEIGGGVGEVQVELLKRGAGHVTNLEISTGYENEAVRLLEQSGMTGRVTRRLVDIALAPDDVEPADVVVLHRVVCCYRDFSRLLSAAAAHARRRLVFTHPPDNLLVRAEFGAENVYRRLTGNAFRAFVHPPEALIAAAESDGLVTTYRHHSREWDVVGLAR